MDQLHSDRTAVGMYGDYFPKTLAPMLAAAESTGDVPETLGDVCVRLRNELEMRAALLNLQRRLDRAGIDVIAEKIEREESLIELLDYDIDFGQGYHLGEPKLAK